MLFDHRVVGLHVRQAEPERFLRPAAPPAETPAASPTPPHPSPKLVPKGPKPGATNFISPAPLPEVEGIVASPVKPPPRILPQVPIVKPVASAPVSSPLPPARPAYEPSPPTLTLSDAPSDCIPVTFDEEASCVVIGESEYYYSSRDAIATVGQLCSFLEVRLRCGWDLTCTRPKRTFVER